MLQRVDSSVGSVGDALGEITVGSFKNELIRRQGPWRDVNQVESFTARWAQYQKRLSGTCQLR